MRYNGSPDIRIILYKIMIFLGELMLLSLLVPVLWYNISTISLCLSPMPWPIDFVQTLIEFVIGVRQAVIRFTMLPYLTINGSDRVVTPQIKVTSGMRYDRSTNTSVDWNTLVNRKIPEKDYLKLSLDKCKQSIWSNVQKLERSHFLFVD